MQGAVHLQGWELRSDLLNPFSQMANNAEITAADGGWANMTLVGPLA